MIPQKVIHEVFKRDNYTCQLCGFNGTEKTLHIAHARARILGGTDEVTNFVTLCPTCHFARDAKGLSDYLQEVISRNTAFHQTFKESIQNIRYLINVDVSDANLKEIMNRLLFANTITAMETYLSDAFINTVTNDPGLIKKLMETTPAFNDKKYKLSDVLTWLEDTKKSVSQYLLEIIYHNVFVVKNMYKCVLDIDFPDNMELIQKAVMTRHDIVHRNGKTKTGIALQINSEDVLSNLTIIETFIGGVDEQLKAKVRNKGFAKNITGKSD